jgi:hypothetical protein
MSDQRRRELGGPDPIDRRLGAPPPSPLGWLFSLLRTRSALGLAPSLTPGVVYMPLGVLLGPLALNLVTGDVRTLLDLSVTLTLTLLGIFVGIAFGREVPSVGRLLVAASLESAITILAVAGATAYLVVSTGLPFDASVIIIALALGLCASASSATSADPDADPAAAVATRVADLDDILPIIVAAGIFTVATGTGSDRWWIALTPVGAGILTGVIGWLLFERAESVAERSVYVLGTVALAGGAAAFMHVSPLSVGLVAGLFWTLMPGRADRIVQDDLGKLQHPLVVLLLVTAGALWVPSAVGLWLLVPFLLFRLAGKVAGGWVAARIVGDVRPGDMAAYLMSPGVLSIAFALNFLQILPTASGDALLWAVMIGTAVFEVFAVVALPLWRREAR